MSEDPVALDIVSSLSRPGGNATGINFFVTEIDAKRFELMHELLPKATSFAVLNAQPTPQPARQRRSAEGGPRTLGLEVLFFDASTPAGIDAAFAGLGRERSDALFIAPEGFFASRAVQFATLTARDRMPASFATREMVEAGLLMSYGVNFADTFRQVGHYVGGSSRGRSPPICRSFSRPSSSSSSICNRPGARLEVPPNSARPRRRGDRMRAAGVHRAAWRRGGVAARGARRRPAIPVVGFLRTTPSAPFAHLVAAFRRGLSDVGFVRVRT